MEFTCNRCDRLFEEDFDSMLESHGIPYSIEPEVTEAVKAEVCTHLEENLEYVCIECYRKQIYPEVTLH